MKKNLPVVSQNKAKNKSNEPWVMKYIPPDIGDNKVVYKGKRYWIIEFTGVDEIDGLGRDVCQYVMYDKLYQSILACIDIKDKKYYAYLNWGIDDISDSFETLKEVALNMPRMDVAYAKHCFGDAEI